MGGCEVLKHEWKKEFKRLALSESVVATVVSWTSVGID